MKAPVEKMADGTVLKCGGDVNARVGLASDGGRTALHNAAENHHCDVVGYLLKQPGIEVDKARTDYGETPLFMAADKGFGDVVKQLIAAKADVNKAKTDDGTTPLIIAAMEGHANAVKQLLDANSDIHHTTTVEDGSYTALKIAKEKSQTEVVAMLIAAGAN